MFDYYTDKLSANRLKRAYEIAPSRVRQYLQAEIDYVNSKINPGDMVLELGCGYGRVLNELSSEAKLIFGIDTSFASLQLAQETLSDKPSYHLTCANALHLPFPDRTFDLVACIQNGISAFHVDPHALFQEAVRVTKSGGLSLFSTYSDKFWNHRLEWFHLQSRAGLLGEMDEVKTGNGVIVCKDGFTGTAFTSEQLLSFAADRAATTTIKEINRSSLFCEIRKL
jgi:2-polyprenyl-6-hydroxyphenyl methylase/3-demethylubiquinone-9 3-methyltransferase